MKHAKRVMHAKHAMYRSTPNTPFREARQAHYILKHARHSIL